MTPPAVEEVTRLFREMQAAPPDAPGTMRRRLRIPALGHEVHLEVSFPDASRVLAVGVPDTVQPHQLRDTAGLRCTSDGHTVRVAAEPIVEPDVFATLVADLVHHLAAEVKAPGAALVRRLASWQRMLAAGLRTGLSARAQLGLYGELLVLRELILPTWGPQTTASWVGPTGADQDFRHGGVAVEVKSVSQREPQRCRVSSERQLDTDGISYLVLVHQRVRTSVDSGVSLPDVVDAVRADPFIAHDPDLFEDRLLHGGWLDLHRRQYERERYELTARRCYHISEGFPRLTTRQLPAGVSAVTYSIDLSACDRFLVPETNFLRSTAQPTLGASRAHEL